MFSRAFLPQEPPHEPTFLEPLPKGIKNRNHDPRDSGFLITACSPFGYSQYASEAFKYGIPIMFYHVVRGLPNTDFIGMSPKMFAVRQAIHYLHKGGDYLPVVEFGCLELYKACIALERCTEAFYGHKTDYAELTSETANNQRYGIMEFLVGDYAPTFVGGVLDGRFVADAVEHGYLDIAERAPALFSQYDYVPHRPDEYFNDKRIGGHPVTNRAEDIKQLGRDLLTAWEIRYMFMQLRDENTYDDADHLPNKAGFYMLEHALMAHKFNPAAIELPDKKRGWYFDYLVNVKHMDWLV